MRNIQLLLSRSLLLTAIVLAVGAAAAVEPAVKVDWTDPGRFADSRQTRCWSRERPETWLAPLAQHLERRAAGLLADGEQLAITLTDVRRAGDCEPGRAPRSDEIRIVRDIYPPRIELRYTLKDADDHLLREGQASLRDPAFLLRSSLVASDPLRHEKRLLDDWLQREFAHNDSD